MHFTMLFPQQSYFPSARIHVVSGLHAYSSIPIEKLHNTLYILSPGQALRSKHVVIVVWLFDILLHMNNMSILHRLVLFLVTDYRLEIRFEFKHINVNGLVGQRIFRVCSLEKVDLGFHTNQLHKIERIM